MNEFIANVAILTLLAMAAVVLMSALFNRRRPM